MSWLVAPIITSIVFSILIVKVWGIVFGGVSNIFLGVAQGGLVIGMWTAITTAAGMRGVNNMTRRLNGSATLRRLRALTKGERP